MNIETSNIHVTRDGAVETITINRPEKKNALTLSMYEALTSSLNHACEDDEVRAIILRGAGGVFTSGNDLTDFMRSPPTSVDTPVFHFLSALLNCAKPLIAAVDGAAIGIGTTMLLHCDFVYSSARSVFQLPFIRLGLVPEAGATLLLPALVGHPKAAELLMLGDRFDAQQAEGFGLINGVVASEDLMMTVQERAAQLASLPPAAMRQTKALLLSPRREALEQVMVAEGEHFIRRLSSPETKEAFSAFFERRSPDFSRFS